MCWRLQANEGDQMTVVAKGTHRIIPDLDASPRSEIDSVMKESAHAQVAWQAMDPDGRHAPGDSPGRFMSARQGRSVSRPIARNTSIQQRNQKDQPTQIIPPEGPAQADRNSLSVGLKRSHLNIAGDK
jgi:hypothetical protein